MLHLLLSSTVISMLLALLNLLTSYLPNSRGLAAHDYLLPLIPILSTHLMHELTNIFNLSSLLLVNSGTLYLNLYFHLPTTWTHLREEYQDACYPNLASLFFITLFYLGNRQLSGFIYIICMPVASSPIYSEQLLCRTSADSLGSCVKDECEKPDRQASIRCNTWKFWSVTESIGCSLWEKKVYKEKWIS